MSALSLAQLRTPETAASIRARLVANLVAAGFPVSSWAPSAAGGPENAYLDAVAGTLNNYAGELMSTVAAMRFLDLATGDLLTFFAKSFFFIDRTLATKTRISLRLTSTPEAPPYTITVGDFVFQGPTGNRYISSTGGSLPSGLLLFIEADAEEAGSAFFDPDRSIDSIKSPAAMITPLPGVDVINIPSRDLTVPKLIGNSAGLVDSGLTVPGVFPTYSAVRIRVTRSGVVGTGAWQYSIDNGQTWINGGPFTPSANLTGGVTVFFSNAPGVSPSFLAGDSWSFQVASATIAQGTDDETDEALRQRCRFRWPALSDVPTAGKIALWAHEASPEVGQLLADADVSVPGQIDLIIAGANGPVGVDTASIVQDFISPRLLGYQGLSIQETILVTPAKPHPISASGTVKLPRRTLAAVQKQALTNWLAYLRSVRIAGVVRLAELEQAIMDAGASGTIGLAIVDGSPNVQLDIAEIAVPPSDGSSILTSLAWVPL